MEEDVERESITDDFEPVLRMELWYRAGANCPLRAITHQPDGCKKPEWEKFQQAQHASFQERIIPCRVPPLLAALPLESTVIVLSMIRVFAFPVMCESELEMCRGSLKAFLHTLGNALTLHKQTGGTYVFYLHSQCVPFCLHGVFSSTSCPSTPPPAFVSSSRPSEL